MKIKVLGSSSAGNSYLLQSDKGEVLIIEAGIAFKDIVKGLNGSLSDVVGCLVSHEHGDHSKSIQQMVDNGITTYALNDVWVHRNVRRTSRAVDMLPNKGYVIGGYKVVAFEALHDVRCLGFVIQHEEMGNLLFLTDSYRCPVQVLNLNHILIECNYSLPVLIEAINSGRTFSSQKKRLEESHMELQNCKNYLMSTDLTEVREIVLLHLSERNSKGDIMVDEIQGATGIPTYIADRGLELQLT